jgi:hypothetical protein
MEGSKGHGLRSESEEVNRFVGSWPRETGASEGEAKAFVHQGRDPLVLEWDERTDSELSYNLIRFPGVPADQVRQCDGLRHADGFRGKESFEGEEITGIGRVGLDGSFLEHPADELGLRNGWVQTAHRCQAPTMPDD